MLKSTTFLSRRGAKSTRISCYTSAMNRLSRWLPAALALAALAFGLAARADLAPSPMQGKTATDLVRKLETGHYSRLRFDDSLSSRLLDTYLKSLDPSRSFLYKSDVEAFESLRHQLDDEFRRGSLNAGFTIFNRYHDRISSRFDKLLAELPDMIAKFDFTVDESLSLEPEKLDWPIGEVEADERWRKEVKNAVLGLKLAGKDEDEILPTLEKRYQNQRNRIAQYNAQDVFMIYANALTRLYDPHTSYMSPHVLENFNINMSLSLEGIGAVLQRQEEHTQVVRLVPAGPADKQGELQPSDRIVAVAQGEDGQFEDVVGWRLDEVVKLIRGAKGTTVRLEVLPAKSVTQDQRKVISIVRNTVKLEEQSAKKDIIEIPRGDRMLKLGVIDIPTFYADFEGKRRGDANFKSTTRDVKGLLDELMAESVDGIVIDLRGNGGGSLQEANDLVGLFVNRGPTVQVHNASRNRAQVYHTPGMVIFRGGKVVNTPYYDGPLLVLINRLSASASEIFTGAIQDYQRGIVVGSQSFGKGTVQTLVPLTEGQLKLTEAKFYRISGDSTQHRGVIPDVEFPSRYDPAETGESTLDHALNWDQINPLKHRKYLDIPALVPYLTDIHQARVGTNPDFVYLKDSLELAERADALTSLSLNEKARIALREEREAQSLMIENKRRKAKGLPPLTELEDAANDDGEDDLADGDKPGGEGSWMENGSGAVGGDDEVAAVAGKNGGVSAVVGKDNGAAANEEQPGAAEADDEDEEPDVLLREAGNILVDALTASESSAAKSREAAL